MALPKNSKVNELYDQFVILRDSVFKTETATKIADYKVLYETEKKESQNKLLQQEISLKQSKIDARNKTIIGLLIGVALIILLIVWRLNVIKLKKKLIEIENEKKFQQDRERISRDLHDNVGGQLSYVMFSLEGNEELTQEKRMDKNHQLANALRDVTGNLRETIWTLNKEELSLQDIADKLKLYARNMFAYSSTKLKFNESIEDDKPLNPVFALTIFRICQEIINNVFKHAQATELTITIVKNENIQITIADNGIGFASNSSDGNSFGLSNLQTRAVEINAKLEITSEINKGTRITFVV
jgi:signal transduction histidine kinase